MNTRIASTIPSSTIIVPILGTVLIGLVILYMYLLSMSVVHVVMRKELTLAIRETESDIARLETDFIHAQHTVSERIASATQFYETDEKIFVRRSPDALVLSRINP
jgi:hypothetical protein